MGKKEWEEAPKEFQTTAKLTFHTRSPFVASQSGVQASSNSVANENESQVLREVLSDEILGEIVTKLDLAKKWGMAPAEVIMQLRSGVELDLTKERAELNVQVTLYDPAEAAEVANAIAEAVPGLIKVLDERNKVEGFKGLEMEVQPLVDEEFAALSRLKERLKENGITIEPGPGVDLGDYLFIREVLDAKVEWDAAREILASMSKGQAEYRNYWGRSVKPSFIAARAEPPGGFVGPAVEPFQIRWSVYGMTAGMMLGSILMLIFWKLFR